MLAKYLINKCGRLEERFNFEGKSVDDFVNVAKVTFTSNGIAVDGNESFSFFFFIFSIFSKLLVDVMF